MTPNVQHDYRLPLPYDGIWHEILNSDATNYGGSGMGNLGAVRAENGAARLTLPPLATIMLHGDH